jgi:predicted hydrolase (HD superfamily)
MRVQAVALLHEWVSSESLRKHCYAVAAAMEGYAIKHRLSEKEIDEWYIAGLLHDMDYEKFPTLDKHPFEGVRVLGEKGYSHEIIEAILGHGNHTNVKRESLMAKTLFAVDELSGLLVALSKVKADGFATMTAESVEKALKKKGFAAAVNREDIEQGIRELGVERESHFTCVIQSLKRSFK